MTRYLTTREWADLYNLGEVLEGTIHWVKKEGTLTPGRTHCLKLSEPFLGYEYLTFDLADLEEVQ